MYLLLAIALDCNIGHSCNPDAPELFVRDLGTYATEAECREGERVALALWLYDIIDPVAGENFRLACERY